MNFWSTLLLTDLRENENFAPTWSLQAGGLYWFPFTICLASGISWISQVPPRRKPKTLNSHKIDEDVCLNFCPSNMWDREGEGGCKKSWNLGVSYGCTRWEENKTGASIAIQCNTTLCTSMNTWWEERKNDFIAKLSQSITSFPPSASPPTSSRSFWDWFTLSPMHWCNKNVCNAAQPNAVNAMQVNATQSNAMSLIDFYQDCLALSFLIAPSLYLYTQ